MSMVVNHNLSALVTVRHLNTSHRMMSKSLQKLSSGYRINAGADSPADLIISEKLRAQNAGLKRAVRNTQEAQNVLAIAEGALNEMNEMLKTMRQLALHASNSGVTSPSQIAADQAEVDSSIQTIDRIANTTKYSTTFLLNGSQSLSFDRTVTFDRATDAELLNVGNTRFEQVFKREGYKVAINFAGAVDPDETYTEGTHQATRAMLEASSDVTGTDIDTTNANTLSADQRFTITGTKGSRAFEFGQGTHLGEIVTSINNVADSMGVSAQLVFDNSVTGAAQNAGSAALATFGVTRATGNEIATYHMDSTWQQDGDHASETVDVTLAGADPLGNADVGRNTDGHGRVYLKWKTGGVGGTYDIYRDAALRMKIGEGQSGVAGQAFLREAAWTGGAGGTVQFDASASVAAGDVTMVQLGSAHTLAGTELDASLASSVGLTDVSDGTAVQSTLSGIDLGYNTDSHGRLYLRVETGSAGAGDGTVSLYKDSAMRGEDLVAQARNVNLIQAVDGADAGDFLVSLSAVNMAGGDGPSSDLYATLSFNELALETLGENTAALGEIAARNLGVRLYANEYGANSYVKVDAQAGAFWSQYGDPNDNTTATLMDASGGAQSTTVHGQDATVTVNGRQVQLDGVSGKIANQDLGARFVFNKGRLGKTTIAQTGYENGTLHSRARDVNDLGSAAAEGNYATNAIQNSSEVLDNFTGGMQLQLTEDQGDVARTVYAIPSVSVANIGRVDFFDEFEQMGLKEWRTLALSDVLGGGYASLETDPVRAMSVIDQSIDDITDLRAQLGAFQLTQANINNLKVHIEEITSTESYIRDADMAAVSASYTKEAILLRTSTTMLVQANATQQGVLRLLR
jgi:flagellin